MPVPAQVPLPEWIARGLGFGADPGPLGAAVAGLLAGAVVGTVLLGNAAVIVWGKRKIAAAFWGKVGPNRIGPWGLLIIVADAVKFLSKELIVPENVDRPAYDLAPILMLASAIAGFAVIPMGAVFGVSFHLADPEIGLVYVFAVSALATLGLVMGGYASNNKYALLGTLRAVAGSLSYEIPLVLAGASVALLAGSLRLSDIVAAQTGTLFALGPVSIPSWFVFVNPLAFGVFLVASFAEIARNPFDTPEASTELVAGYMTEYSAVYFVFFYVAEFLHIFLAGAIVTTLFLGGPAGPVLPGLVWFLAKMWGFFLLTQWARSAVPRVRIDQLVAMGWRGLLVLALLNLVVSAAIVGLLG